MPNEKVLWGSAQIFPVPVVAAVYRWLRGMPHPELERIKMSNPDDAVHQNFGNYYSNILYIENSIKTNINLIYTAVWGWELQNTLKRRVMKRMLSQYQLNINHIHLISNKQTEF